MKTNRRIHLGKLTRYGTKGFLSVLIAAQLATVPYALAAETSGEKVQDKLDRSGTNLKKSGRSIKNDAKKAGRKATGQDNTWDNVKDDVKDAGRNAADEAEYQRRKIERKAD